MEIGKNYLNEKQVANLMSFSIFTLRNWRTQGKGPAYTKTSRAVRYSADDVIRFMEDRKVNPLNEKS